MVMGLVVENGRDATRRVGSVRNLVRLDQSGQTRTEKGKDQTRPVVLLRHVCTVGADPAMTRRDMSSRI
jgi:hypothetical protein